MRFAHVTLYSIAYATAMAAGASTDHAHANAVASEKAAMEEIIGVSEPATRWKLTCHWLLSLFWNARRGFLMAKS